jgi:hypothetical protein
MSDLKFDEMVEFLPNFSRDLPGDDKFLYFFTPVNVDQKFLFGLNFKTGVQIFSVIALIQAISSFFDIFSPKSFVRFFASIIACGIYFTIAAYAFLSTLKTNYSYAKVSYLIIAVIFLIEACIYLSKSVIKTIEFITPWDGDFLRLDFLIYVFGYGVYLFIYLYFIYILYRYMNQLKNPSENEISAALNNEEQKELKEENNES